MFFATICFAIAAILLTIAFADDLKEFATVAGKSYRDNSHYDYTYIFDKASILTIKGIRQRWHIILDTAGTIRQYYASKRVHEALTYARKES